MSLYPQWAVSPSESTVEQLSNHLILLLLWPHPAWFFVPTRREELGLGYDASLQGMKACAIQYKRIRPLKRPVGVAATINQTQLKTLRAKFPAAAVPYVFFAVAEYWDYAALGHALRTGHPLTPATSIVFLDAHQIPVAASTLRFTRAAPAAPPIVEPYSGGKSVGPGFPCMDLFQFARRLTACEIGSDPREVDATLATDRRGRLGRTSLLYVKRTA